MPTTPAWRTLSGAEFAAAPEAKLNGVLALIMAASVALIIFVGLALAFVTFALVGFGGMPWSELFRAAIDAVTIPTEPRALGTRVVTWQQVAMVIWALVFIAMTMMRSAATPKVASVLMVLWVIMAMGGNALVRHVNLPNGLDTFTLLSMMPYILFNIIVTAAFWGYMQDGRQPNIYYRKRVRA